MSAQAIVACGAAVVFFAAAVLILRSWCRDTPTEPRYRGTLTEYLDIHGLRVVTTPDSQFVVVNSQGLQITHPAKTATAAALEAVYCPAGHPRSRQ